jgi:membrane protein implicated in regulation of membrane protease activity
MNAANHLLGIIVAILAMLLIHLSVFLAWPLNLLCVAVVGMVLYWMVALGIHIAEDAQARSYHIQQAYNDIRREILDVSKIAYNSLDSVTLILDDYNNLEDRIDAKCRRLRTSPRER